MSTQITICGNTTGEVDLRFTPSGKAVANFTVAVNERRKNSATGDWEDDGATFYRCTAWDQFAEHIAETLTNKGTRVIVTGRIRNREWEDREGTKRLSLEIDVDDIGPSLRYATATVNRGERTTQAPQTRPPAGQAAGPGTTRQQGARRQSYVADPWAAQGPNPALDLEEPPF